ncbi:co-chaperone GroES [Williamwhitmania taraxaci]|uniref:Co-chaperonin GroES n=1 Tax=Williamwhitmania taraxaci TaxID=1640674 RepID=A0A1G6S232_9BACT|nr:co-chaperone GroES [Williamwhitmania taraxaci]SDD10733.1 chaperonin GroES [Williamwhitmania taraxaci]
MSKVKFTPLADRVLVEPKEAEEKTASGIYIPDTAKEKPQRGKVVAVGIGAKDITMEVKVGDEVLYGKYAGTEITIEGKDYLVMKQSDIFGCL